MLANLRHAANTGKGAHVGGGDFSPAECAATADRLEQANRMEAALQTILNISLMDSSHWAKTVEAEAQGALK